MWKVFRNKRLIVKHTRRIFLTIQAAYARVELSLYTRCHRHTKRTYRAKNNIILYDIFEKRGKITRDKERERKREREYNTIFSYWQVVIIINSRLQSRQPCWCTEGILCIYYNFKNIIFGWCNSQQCRRIIHTPTIAITVASTMRQLADDLALYCLEWKTTLHVGHGSNLSGWHFRFFSPISLSPSPSFFLSAFSHRAQQVQLIVAATIVPHYIIHI